MSRKGKAPADSKSLVLSIHQILPDDPIDALSVMCLALAFLAAGAGYSRRVVDAGLDIALEKANAEAKRQGWTP